MPLDGIMCTYYMPLGYSSSTTLSDMPLDGIMCMYHMPLGCTSNSTLSDMPLDGIMYVSHAFKTPSSTDLAYHESNLLMS